MQYCSMHNSAVKSNLVDSGSETNKLGSRGNDRPLCPKPRRIGPVIPDFLKPQRCSKHRFDCSLHCSSFNCSIFLYFLLL